MQCSLKIQFLLLISAELEYDPAIFKLQRELYPTSEAW